MFSNKNYMKNYMSSMFRNLLDLVMEFLAGLGGLWYGHRAVISNFPIVGSVYGW